MHENIPKFRNAEERKNEILRRWSLPQADPDAPAGIPYENQLTNAEFMDLMMRGTCHYCGDQLWWNCLEPADESKPINIKNVICICQPCKLLKLDLSRTEFKNKLESE